MARSIRLTQIVTIADQIAAQLHGLHFAGLKSADSAWQPAVNVYACADRIEVCVMSRRFAAIGALTPARCRAV